MVAEKANEVEHNPVLTKREEQVLTLVAKGMTNKEIAGILFIAESTVKSHLGSILEKMHAHNRTEAVVMAKEGLKDFKAE
ncbi:response regulator transcription factor [Chloroflexota bacterium]